MIRFSLKCEQDHRFESWFASGDAFETLLSRGMISCPECGATHVTKDLMAPKVRPSRNQAAANPPMADPQMPTTQMAKTPDAEVENAIKKLKAHVEKTSDYVGSDFVSEARAMHDGDIPQRSIHGEARPDEAKKLIEDGVPALPLPFIPRQKAN